MSLGLAGLAMVSGLFGCLYGIYMAYRRFVLICRYRCSHSWQICLEWWLYEIMQIVSGLLSTRVGSVMFVLSPKKLAVTWLSLVPCREHHAHCYQDMDAQVVIYQLSVLFFILPYGIGCVRRSFCCAAFCAKGFPCPLTHGNMQRGCRGACRQLARRRRCGPCAHSRPLVHRSGHCRK
jgi:hypothetical protein